MIRGWFEMTKLLPGTRTIDETGNKYSKLTVIRSIGADERRQANWECLCECGNNTIVRGNALRTGSVRSCGCLFGRRLPKGEAGFNTLYYEYKFRATNQNLSFELTKEQFKELTSAKCHYCEQEPKLVNKTPNPEWGWYTYNGVDRVDNSKGYTIDNSVSSCGGITGCNTKKNNCTLDIMIKALEFLGYTVTPPK